MEKKLKKRLTIFMALIIISIIFSSFINSNSIFSFIYSVFISIAFPALTIGIIIYTISKNPISSGTTYYKPDIIEMTKCPKCGRVLNAANKYCPECFTSLIPHKCPKCGFVNVSYAKFCKECGTEIKTIIEPKELLGFPLDCPECHKPLTELSNNCEHCGKDIGEFIKENLLKHDASYGSPIDSSGIDMNLINSTESKAISLLIKKELEIISPNKHLTLPKMEIKKLIATIIFALISFITISLYAFYHTYLGLGILIFLVGFIIYFILTRKYDLNKYIQTEVKKRPDTKISYIVSSTVAQATPMNIFNPVLRVFILVLALGGCIVLYKEPHYIYEHQKEGYALRYYTYGFIRQEKEVVIPSTYKNEPVIGIRGDTFKNVNSIVSVTLPDTITEIRGGAFQGCSSLSSINLPSKITEIHGSTFEDCYSLEEIVIPEGVTRIGGSAFRNCTNLRTAIIPESVREIGSSAFRNTDLSSVCISSYAYVNERAFKETYAAIRYYENNCESTYVKEDEYQYDY